MTNKIITEELVLKALCSDVGEAILTSWTSESGSKPGEIFFNDPIRIRVTYVQAGEEKKKSYFAKVNPQKENDSFNPYRNHGMRKEIFFYTELLPLLNKELESINKNKIKVPKCLAFSLECKKEVIILEDISIKGFSTYDRKHPMDTGHAALMMDELAKLHSASILLQKRHAGKPLTEIFPLLVEAWFVNGDIYSEGFSDIFVKGMLGNVYMAKNLPKYNKIVPWLNNLSCRAMDTIKSHMISCEKWMEICHGDYHRTNVLFKYENNKPVDIMVLDWQTVRLAPIGSEIGYFMHSSFAGDQIEEVDQIITPTIYKEMSRYLHIQMPYTLEDLENHCKSNFCGFLLCFYLLPLSVSGNDPAAMFHVTKKDLHPDPEGVQKAKEMLAENQVLLTMITYMFEYIVKQNLDKKI